MKLSIRSPGMAELVAVYNKYQLNEMDIDSFFDSYGWCRFDPRLGELLIYFIKQNWNFWNPFDVANYLKSSPWPQVFGVLGSHVALLLLREERQVFLKWLDCCFYHVPLQKEWSTFFIDIFKFGGKQLKNEAFDSISLYLQWGYYAKHPMIQFALATPTSQRTLIKKEQRLEKLTNLFQLKKRIRVQDYIEFLDYKISKRTAEIDLSQWANKTGQTKGATYTLR